MQNTINLNGSRVVRRENVIFIPLPRELWRDSGGCCCPYCSEDNHEHGPAYWDTLAVAIKHDPKSSTDHTWTVHYPELHGAERKRADW